MDFKILGPVSAEVDGRPVDLDGAKQRTVLATLLLARGRVVTDERLTTLLWGWEPPATSTNQLYTYVSRLRTRLGPAHGLSRHGAGYRMDLSGATLDWDRFGALAAAGRADLLAGHYAGAERRLADALALWHGPALGDVTEQLADAEGPRLTEARLTAVEQHAEAALALGRHDDLLPALTRHVTGHPAREHARGQLMTALFRSGRQADALARYEDGRRLLAEELGIDPGPELRALHAEILTGTLPGPAAAERVRATPGATAATAATAVGSDTATDPRPAPLPTPRPALLPAAPRDFTGREQQTRLVLTALSEDRDVTLTGAPGTGKSALALTAAEQARPAFPDGQLYADLRTPDGAPRDPGEVLGWFLRALGAAPGRLPAGLEERAQLYRTLLAGRRLLVVLDNADDDTQVRPLLPGGGATRTLVTGVRPAPAALEGALLVRLGPLSPTEAARLLARIAGAGRLAADPESAARIAEHCDRLPLALRIAATRLADRPHWAPARLADRLATEDRRLAELRFGSLDLAAALRPALDALDAPAAAALAVLADAALAVLTAPDAAALLDLPLPDADDLLDRLADARLLEPCPAAGAFPQYRLLPLVGLLARRAVAVG
ncbi:transcriptional regulator [Kitasatospora sp. NBC_01560]|uniref:AfsR/SARP family transcriptional regulator n=1 Tax=Kitasatospora sp. NBC_01560 TaxID=2975965 RepID=UPI0038694EA0